VYAKTLNVEIKARCPDIGQVRDRLQELKAIRRGRDEQTDTYFVVPEGRMKLREGTIENSLIYYRRTDQPGPKASHVSRFDLDAGERSIKTVLTDALGVSAVVRKTREIYFLSNIKIHLDEVEGLGSFLEIEAIDATGQRTKAQLRRQCRTLMRKLGVSAQDLLDGSYSDMVASTGHSEALADAA
jgi:adenylate cyclase, class 2